MIILRNLIWIWTVCYIIDLLWYKFNTNFIGDFYKKHYDYFDYDFYRILFYLVTLIGAPLIAGVIIVGEVYLFLTFLPRKIKAWFAIWRISDKEVRKKLRKELRNL